VIRTAFTDLVGCTIPIQLAGMPGIATPELVAAVAGTGAVAMLPATGMTPASLEQSLAELGRKRLRGVIGTNFLMPFLDRDCVAVAAGNAKIVEFFFGDPDADLVRQAAEHGAIVGWQVGSVAEAQAAERAGCAFVIAQGTEAGGHVRGRDSILAVLPDVLEAVRIPVVAAGGIGSARDLAAVLAFGAGAARLGTRFVAAAESGAHPTYVRALIAARAEDTCLTGAFSVLWPDAPHRVLRSALLAAERCRQDPLGETRHGGQTVPVPRLSVYAPTKETTGNIEAMALYAGESVVDVRGIEPAASIVRSLIDEAESLLAATR